MAKTKPFSFRIEQNLYDQIKGIALSQKTTFTDAIEKALSYFSYYPREILEFDARSVSQKDIIQLLQHPSMSIHGLREEGISTKSECLFIVQLMQQAWHNSRSTATAAWVANVAKSFQLLLQLEIGNKDELMYFFLSTYPGEGTIEERINMSLNFVNRKERVSSPYADLITRCLLVLVRDGKFFIPKETFPEINKLLTPWCFWVAKRAIQKETMKDIDITPLLKVGEKKVLREKSLLIEKEKASGQVLLSVEGVGPFHAGNRDFACALTISEGVKYKATFACSPQTFLELIETVSLLEERKAARYGQWEIVKDFEHNIFYIEKGGVRVPVTKEELLDFSQVVKDIYACEEVQIDLIQNYVETYGAL